MPTNHGYISGEEFGRLFANAEPSPAVKGLYDDLAREAMEETVDRVALRIGQDYSFINSQVVGAENRDR